MIRRICGCTPSGAFHLWVRHRPLALHQRCVVVATIRVGTLAVAVLRDCCFPILCAGQLIYGHGKKSRSIGSITDEWLWIRSFPGTAKAMLRVLTEEGSFCPFSLVAALQELDESYSLQDLGCALCMAVEGKAPKPQANNDVDYELPPDLLSHGRFPRDLAAVMRRLATPTCHANSSTASPKELLQLNVKSAPKRVNTKSPATCASHTSTYVRLSEENFTSDASSEEHVDPYLAVTSPIDEVGANFKRPLVQPDVKPAAGAAKAKRWRHNYEDVVQGCHTVAWEGQADGVSMRKASTLHCSVCGATSKSSAGSRFRMSLCRGASIP